MQKTEIYTIDKLEHTEEIIPAVSATCFSEGLTEGKKCSACGEILAAQQKIPQSTTHRLDVSAVIDSPTYTEDGSAIYVCADYGEYDFITDKALGHDFIYDTDADAEGANLSLSFYCSRCDYLGNLSGITKIKITKAADCSNFGSATLTLPDGTSKNVATKKTNVHYFKGNLINENATIEYQDGVTIIGGREPNCQNSCDGFFNCDICNRPYLINVIGSHSSAPSNFDYTNEEIFKAPTATESGFIKYNCSICGERLEEELAPNTHIIHYLNGKAVNFNTIIEYQDGVTIFGGEEPNCQNSCPGCFKCDICDKELFINVKARHTVPTSFDYTNEEKYKAPTPTENGFIEYECAVCADELYETLSPHTHEVKCNTVTKGEKRYLVITCTDNKCPLNDSIEDIFSNEDSALYKNCVIDVTGLLYLNDEESVTVNQEVALAKNLTLTALSDGGFELTLPAPDYLAYFNLTQPITTVIYYYAK